MNRSWPNALGLFLTALSMFLVLAAIACEEEEGAAPTPTATPSLAATFPLTVTDDQGQQVTFSAAPQRIIALAPSFVEILFAIGTGDALVAVDENTNFPPEAADLAKISGFEPSVEGIASFQPNLVLIFFDPGGLRDALGRLGINVLFLATPDSLDGVLDQIVLLGYVTGHDQEATDLIAQMQERIDAIRARLEEVEQGPRIFHELDPLLFTICPGEFIHDLYVTLKAQNIAAEAGVPCQLSQEAIIAADPEVIILADEPAGVTPESVKARAGWENISAVKNDRVFTVDADIFSRPGPRIVDALEELTGLLYPERFP